MRTRSRAGLTVRSLDGRHPFWSLGSELENVALGVDGATDMKALAARVREVSHAYGLPLDPEREVHTLSVGERQRIEIVWVGSWTAAR